MIGCLFVALLFIVFFWLVCVKLLQAKFLVVCVTPDGVRLVCLLRYYSLFVLFACLCSAVAGKLLVVCVTPDDGRE